MLAVPPVRLLLVLGSCCLCRVSGLFEDQVFKFDWRKQLIGKVEFLKFHGGDSDPLLIVGTQRNVVAALDSENGRILWRHKFEEDGAVGGLRTVAALGKHVLSVSGSTHLFLRIWEPVQGALVQEHLLRPKSDPDLVHLSKSKVWTIDYSHAGVEITGYHFDTKKLGDPTVKQLASEAGRILKCVVGAGELLVCATQSAILYSPLKNSEKLEIISFPDAAGKVSPGSLRVRGSRVQLETEGSMLTYQVELDGLKELPQLVSLATECEGLDVEQLCEERGRDSQGAEYCAKYAKDVKIKFKGAEQVVKMSEERGRVENLWSECSADLDVFQLILSFQDGAFVSVTPRGNVMFTREEGLANIQKVAMVAMGFQDQSFQMRFLSHENMFDPAGLAKNFVDRIRRHVSQLQDFVASITNFRLSDKAKVVTPDRFGLNKVIVAVTEHNKIFGIESISGAILWQTAYPGQFNPNLPAHQPQTYLLVQKDGRSGDYAQAVLVYRHARSVHYMMTFNPLTGSVVSDEPINMLLDQALLLPELPDHELKPVLLIGKDGGAAIYPANAVDCVKQGPPLFVVTNTEPGKLVGNKVVVTDSKAVVLTPVWSLVTPHTEIVSISARDHDERIHSAGRVLADRSVLFKYMNPNLAVVLAKGADSTAKLFINIYLLDLVTGKVYYSANHKKVLPPFHVVHSENWAVYTFFNDKSRRTELVSLELYEGKSQHNASVFSSVENLVTPLVERQAFILPAYDITALKPTITEQGITSKNLLIGTTLGSIVDLPLHMVDPRRPPLDSPVHLREPGIPPYIPELNIPHESILNYNQTLLGVRNIATSPSGLESTSLVFVYGLDMYGTMVTPSKGFDLIKEDFDYLMISAVILGLVLASYVTRKFAQKKMLTQAWK